MFFYIKLITFSGFKQQHVVMKRTHKVWAVCVRGDVWQTLKEQVQSGPAGSQRRGADWQDFAESWLAGTRGNLECREFGNHREKVVVITATLNGKIWQRVGGRAGVNILQDDDVYLCGERCWWKEERAQEKDWSESQSCITMSECRCALIYSWLMTVSSTYICMQHGSFISLLASHMVTVKTIRTEE